MSVSVKRPVRTVLVVEDSPDVRAILKAALEEEGCVTHVAGSGQAAIEMAHRLHPDLITLDIGLPGLTGREVVEQLRADPETRSIPIVAVSAHAVDLDPAISTQVTRVIQKPFYLSEVITTIAEVLGIAVVDGTQGSGGRPV